MCAILFEIIKSDLAGRIGILHTNHGKIETPAYVPVIHPVRQAIATSKIREMGFDLVITNAFITRNYYGQEAVKRGIHDIIKFDGAVMTDSGGYQVLEYGDVDVSPFEIADFERILRDISRDHIVRSAVKRFPGLRLLRQDPFQCYISFIVSANSSIQNIKNTLQKICKKIGPKVKFNKNYFYLFPDPKKIAVAEKHELLSCGLGYRAKAVKKAAEVVVSGEIDFDFLKKSDYHVVKESLLNVSFLLVLLFQIFEKK